MLVPELGEWGVSNAGSKPTGRTVSRGAKERLADRTVKVECAGLAREQALASRRKGGFRTASGRMGWHRGREV